MWEGTEAKASPDPEFISNRKLDNLPRVVRFVGEGMNPASERNFTEASDHTVPLTLVIEVENNKKLALSNS